MDVRILGPVEAVGDAGPLPLGGPKQRLLLAVLAVHHPHPVGAAALAEALWDEHPPATAAKTVQVFVARLRKALGSDAITTTGGGYALALPAEQIDVRRFERLVTAARGDDPQHARALLEQALALWRGPVPAELGHQALRLEDQRIAALEARLEADLALGRHAEIVGELEALVASEPLRERPRAQLMLALYRSGRQADALAVYADARRTLVDELGLEPSPQLRRLQAQILDHDPALAPPPPPRSAPQAVASRRGRRRVAAVAVLVAAAFAGIIAGAGSDDARRTASVRPQAVAVLDARSGRVIDSIDTGATPVAAAAGGGAVWVASAAERTVVRIDASTRKVTGRVGLARMPSALAFGDGALWVGSAVGRHGSVARLEPGAGAVVATTSLSGYDDGDSFAPHTPSSLAVGFDAVWANRGRQRVVRIPTRGGPEVAVRLAPKHSADGIAAGYGAVWLASSADDRLLRLDPRRRRVTASIPIAGHRGARVAGPYRVATGAGGVWVTDAIADRVSRVDPELGAVTATIRVGRRPTEIAAGPDGVWVLNAGDETLMRIDPGRNAVTATVRVPAATSLALAAGALWVPTAGGEAAAAGARPEPPADPLVSASCSAPWPRDRPGDVLLVSDLPTRLGGRRAPVVRDMRRAIRAVLDDHDFRAGRHRVAYQECDDSRGGDTSPEQCAANARAYAANPAVVGVIGPYHSFCATIALPILNAAPGGPVAVVSPSNTYTGLTRAGPATAADEPDRYYPTRLRNYVRTVAPDQRQGEALARLMQEYGVRRAYLLDDGQGTGYAVARHTRDEARSIGLGIAGASTWPAGPEGEDAMASAVSAARPDGVLLAGCFCTGGYEVLARLKRDLGSRVRFFASDEMSAPATIFPRPQPAADGLHIAGAGTAAEGGDAAGRRLLGRIGGDRPVESFEAYVLEAAIATRVVLDAVGRSDGSRGSVVDALRDVELDDGLGAGLRFDAAGDPVAPVFSTYRIDRGSRPQPQRESAGHVFDRLIRLQPR